MVAFVHRQMASTTTSAVISLVMDAMGSTAWGFLESSTSLRVLVQHIGHADFEIQRVIDLVQAGHLAEGGHRLPHSGHCRRHRLWRRRLGRRTAPALRTEVGLACPVGGRLTGPSARPGQQASRAKTVARVCLLPRQQGALVDG
jgi:hypothetical protein